MPTFYDVDPVTGRLTQSGRPQFETDFASLSNGRYDIVGGNLIDNLAGGDIVAQIDANLQHTVTVDDEGNYWLSTVVPTERINTPQTNHVQWSGFLSGTIQKADGTMEVIQRAATFITGFDKQLWVRDIENPGRGDWMQVQYDLNSGQPIERVPSTFRLATPEEALEYAATGYLVSRYSAELSNLVASGIQDAEGNPIETVSDAAAWLASNLDVQGVRFQWLPRGEPIL